MAGDLIPPPSPAGRPAPDPEPPPDDRFATEAGAPAEREPVAAAPVGPSPFRARFGFAFGALIGCGVAAAVLAVTLLTTTGRGPGEGFARDWSAWQPATSDPEDGAAEIARHVGAAYRMSNGKQLVSVTGGPLAVQDIPLSVALRPRKGGIELLEGRGLLYTLNGLGPNGSIKDGRPSRTRHLVLRRQALELALYSFRYLEDVSMVVTLLPPAVQPPAKNGRAGAAGQQPAPPRPDQTQAIFYRPDDLRPQLEVPLSVTIADQAPKAEAYSGVEARRVDSLTMSNLFLASVQQAQDARAYLVLDRPS